MHRNRAENFASEKQRKREKCTRFSPKKAKPGAFWVLEGMGTVENGSNQMRKPSVRTKVNHKTMQHRQKENRRKPSVSAGFLAGAEGLVSPAGSGAAPWWGAPSTDRGGSRDRFAAERHWRSLTPRHAVLEWMWEFGSESRGEPGLSCPSHKITKERCWFGAPRTGHAGYPNPD